MKICYIADMRSPHIKRWIDHFSKEHQIDLISFRYEKPSAMHNSVADYESIGVRVHTIPKRPLSMLLAPITVRTLIKKIVPDVVHAHYLTHYGFLAAISGFHPIVASPWGSDITRDPIGSKVFNFTVKYALRHADLIQCMDGSFVDGVRNLIGDTNAAEILPEGIDTGLFTPVKKILTGHTNVLCMRSSQEPYNVDVLIRAIPYVVKACGDVRFDIINAGADIVETYNLVDKLNVSRHVKFIGHVPNNEVKRMFNHADIYVDTFYKDVPGSGIGKTVLEAMSCEVPVLIADAPGYDLHISHGVNGMVYHGLDNISLADNLIKMIKSPTQMEEMGTRAREYVLAHQDFHDNMAKMENRYKEMIE